MNFWEVNFLRVNFTGALFAGKKTTQKIGSKIGRSRIVSQNSAPNSVSGGAKAPVQKICH